MNTAAWITNNTKEDIKAIVRHGAGAVKKAAFGIWPLSGYLKTLTRYVNVNQEITCGDIFPNTAIATHLFRGAGNEQSTRTANGHEA